MLKRLRAALGVSLTWAAAWGIWGSLATGLGFLLAPAFPGPVWPIILFAGLRSGALGFVGGALFSTILRLGYGRSTLAELRAGRLGLLGAAAGVVIPVILTGVALSAIGFPITLQSIAHTVWAFGVPGLATAYATIRIAQKADAGRELESGSEPRALEAPHTS